MDAYARRPGNLQKVQPYIKSPQEPYGFSGTPTQKHPKNPTASRGPRHKNTPRKHRKTNHPKKPCGFLGTPTIQAAALTAAAFNFNKHHRIFLRCIWFYMRKVQLLRHEWEHQPYLIRRRMHRSIRPCGKK